METDTWCTVPFFGASSHSHFAGVDSSATCNIDDIPIDQTDNLYFDNLFDNLLFDQQYMTSTYQQPVEPELYFSSSSPMGNSTIASTSTKSLDSLAQAKPSKITSPSQDDIPDSPVASGSPSATALALGIPRDQYEKTRASIVGMLRKGKVDGSSATADTNGDYEDLGRAKLSSSAAAAVFARPISRNVSNGTLNGESVTSETAPSTLRTSVSSSATGEDAYLGSPPTSEEDVPASELQSDKEPRRQSLRSSTAADSGRRELSPPPRYDRRSSTKDASAAAAALGMLSASPVKTRRASSRTAKPDFDTFTKYRSGPAPPSSSSPPSMHTDFEHTSTLQSFRQSSSDGHLQPSPRESRSPNGHRSGGSANGGQSTTPVRTRLEDIALKSSVQTKGPRVEADSMDVDGRDNRRYDRGSATGEGYLQQSLSHRTDSMSEDEMQTGRPGVKRTVSGLGPAFNLSPSGSAHSPNRTKGSASSGKGGYGTATGRGMLDRFMEISSSPRRGRTASKSPERPMYGEEYSYEDRLFQGQDDDASPPYPQDGRRARHSPERDVFGDVQVAVHSTPRSAPRSKAALLRSAGNDLPSPLLAQIRLLGDAEYSPVIQSERRSPRSAARGAVLTTSSSSNSNGLGVLSDGSVSASARKRKASYDLTSPRQRTLNFEASPSPPLPASLSFSRPPLAESRSLSGLDSPPLPTSSSYQGFPTSSPRFFRSTPAHPASRVTSSGPFLPPSSSREGLDRPLQLFPYNQPGRDEDMPTLNLPMVPQQSSLMPSNASSRAASAGSVNPLSRQSSEQPSSVPTPTKSAKREKKQKLQRVNSTASSAAATVVDVAETVSGSAEISNFVPMLTPVGQYDEKTKPQFSYAALIGQAIFAAPNRRTSLSDIYRYIMTVYPFYKKTDAGWQNSIRHNLSLNECFVKTSRSADEPGKGCLWSVLAGTEEQFTGGNFYKKGKVPKSATEGSAASSDAGGASGSIAGSSRKAKKAGSVVSASESMSAASGDDSFNEGGSMASFNSGRSAMPIHQQHHPQQHLAPQPHQSRFAQPQPPQYQYQYQDPQYGHYQHQQMDQMDPYNRHHPHQPYPPPQPQSHHLRDARHLRQDNSLDYSEEVGEEVFDDRDESFDMDQQLEEQARRQHHQRHSQQRMPRSQEHRQQLHYSHQQQQMPMQMHQSSQYGQPRRAPYRHGHQRVPSGGSFLRHAMTIQSEDDLDDTDQTNEYEYDREPGSERPSREASNMDDSEQQQSFEQSERSLSTDTARAEEDHADPVKPEQDVTRSPVALRQMPNRRLIKSPPIMSSPPTNVFARMSQPYQPLRTAFNIPGRPNDHIEALMTSPPPSGIMPSDRMRRLPPPTPGGADGIPSHADSSIFLPAPNIRPGKYGKGRMRSGTEGTIPDESEDGAIEKPVLPPISMLSPASNLVSINTQSPISSVRASAANPRTSSPPSSPKRLQDSHSSSGSSANRSPTLARGRFTQFSADTFKTPDRFSTSTGTRISSPGKMGYLPSTTASRALQSIQQTPKIGGNSSSSGGLVTPGGYYDPYEYGQALDDEFDRLQAMQGSESHGRDSRRALPYPSPIDRTPKFQPWSPW